MENQNNLLECGRNIEESIDFEFYKTLFDPVISEIMKFLAIQGKKNITEIAENFTQDRSVISRHLELMNRYGILSKDKNTFLEILKSMFLGIYKSIFMKNIHFLISNRLGK